MKRIWKTRCFIISIFWVICFASCAVAEKSDTQWLIDEEGRYLYGEFNYEMDYNECVDILRKTYSIYEVVPTRELYNGSLRIPENEIAKLNFIGDPQSASFEFSGGKNSALIFHYGQCVSADDFSVLLDEISKVFFPMTNAQIFTFGNYPEQQIFDLPVSSDRAETNRAIAFINQVKSKKGVIQYKYGNLCVVYAKFENKSVDEGCYLHVAFLSGYDDWVGGE